MTPQQIRNEVEKEIERVEKMIYDCECAECSHRGWDEALLNLKIKLSILTEYDKSIKDVANVVKELNELQEAYDILIEENNRLRKKLGYDKQEKK